MKNFLLSSVALLGFTAGAMAADLPRRAAPPIYAPIPVFSWSGFYVGVNAGYGWSTNDNNNDCLGCFGGVVTVDTTPGGATVAPLALPSGAIVFGGNDSRGSRDGFVGGAQIGANWQLTPGSGFVVGVEADIQWLGGDNDSKTAFFGNNLFNHAPVPPFGTPGAGIVAVPVTGSNVAIFNRGGFGGNNGNDWFGTARVRVGYGFDRVLVYATGGFAFTDGGNNNNGFFGVTNGSQLPAAFYVSPAAAVVGSTVGTGGFFGKNSSNDVGWVLGAGVEYAWTNNLTVKLEGLWVSMDNNNNNNNNFAVGNGIIGVSNTGAPIRTTAFLGGNNRNDNEFFVARVGLNYKFGW
ncbi:MAG: outer membrane beta-barrel protein [Microvirga sp.]|jgi:outer membrane immunogenic protein